MFFGLIALSLGGIFLFFLVITCFVDYVERRSTHPRLREDRSSIIGITARQTSYGLFLPVYTPLCVLGASAADMLQGMPK